MKRLIIILLLIIPMAAISQSMNGFTEQEIRAEYSYKIFKVGYTNAGQKYISAKFELGTMAYFFDSKSGLSSSCIQIPVNVTAVNALVEKYNSKYTIISSKEWKAYLSNGYITIIALKYDEKARVSIFTYEPEN